MYSIEQLNREIDELIAKGQQSARWITQEICSRHKVEEGHATLCQYQFTRTCAGKQLVKAEETEGRQQRQMKFMGHGFTHLQQFYVLERDDDEVKVAVLDMTPAEHRAKAQHLRLEAEAKYAHADEHEEMARLKERQSAA